MLTVALVGADGAGKTTIGRQLPRLLGRPTRYVYLGANPASATHALPTTRLVHRLRVRRGTADAGGPPALDRDLGPAPPGPVLRRALRSTRAGARVTHQIAEGTYQRGAIAWHRARGRVVVVDRWYGADHHAHELAPGQHLTASRRVRAAFLRRAFPVPDLVLVLDAPADVLHHRKGEGTVEELAHRRREYLDYLRTVPCGQRIDAAQPLDAVVADVVAAVESAAQAHLLPRAVAS